MKKVLLLLVLLTLCSIVAADDSLAETDEVVIRRIETSALIGNIGAAVGLYWPMTTITELDVTVGPMGAIGNEVVIGGIGAQLPLDITIVGIELPIDFGFAGAAYDWLSKDIEFAGGVGAVFVAEF